MRTHKITKAGLDSMLEDHAIWVYSFEEEGEKAVFSDVDFTGMDFTGVVFTGVDFTGTDFSDVDFSETNFSGADFRGAKFKDADLEGAIILPGWKLTKIEENENEQ